MSNFLEEVSAEVKRRRKEGKSVDSIHEGYGLLAEEVYEFFLEVCKKTSKRTNKLAHGELIQIAALCQRISEDLKLNS